STLWSHHPRLEAAHIDHPRMNGQTQDSHQRAGGNGLEHRSEPHQLEAVHQLQQREHQQHRQERDDDAHRSTLSEIMASRRGRCWSSNSSAPPNDNVMSWFESTVNRMSTWPPTVPAVRRALSLSTLVDRPVAKRAGLSHVA